MTDLLHLSVIAPDRVLLDVRAARRVRLKLADQAWLSVYPNHAPLLAEVLPGPLQYETEGETGELQIGSAILYVDSNEVTVLASGQRDGRDLVTTKDAAEGMRFDRLAGELMAALRARTVASGQATAEVPDLGGAADEA